ncbi:MAG: zinc-binding dehydrogenase, partial [Pseudonocardia sp.]|nr:zinc-binding dehydrogenase [Pseudonocardia sp.]
MYAITLPTFGGPEVMRWSQVPDPVPGPGEVVVDVAASAVNRADTLQRQGHYPPPPGASEVPGLECSGVIVELGDGVTEWQVGQEVCALLAGGGYAQRVVVPAAQLMPVPAGVDLIEAAGIPEVACTVWSNVVMRAGLHDGQTFLVHGGSGGIGTHAIQVASALGCTVATTAGSDERLARCRDLGAQITINHRTEDFVERLRAAGPGADVVADRATRLPTGWFRAKRGVTRLVPGLRAAVLDALVRGGRVDREPGGFLRLARWWPDTVLRDTLLAGVAAALRDGVATDARTACSSETSPAMRAEHRVLDGRRRELRERARLVADG